MSTRTVEAHLLPCRRGRLRSPRGILLLRLLRLDRTDKHSLSDQMYVSRLKVWKLTKATPVASHATAEATPETTPEASSKASSRSKTAERGHIRVDRLGLAAKTSTETGGFPTLDGPAALNINADILLQDRDVLGVLVGS